MLISAQEMSVPDYSQTAELHRSFCILARPLDESFSQDDMEKLADKLLSIHTVRIPNDHRCMLVCCRTQCPLENNDWGDFQYHRKVLGLICLAKNPPLGGMSGVEKTYREVKGLYNSTLIDSRLVVLGLDKQKSQAQHEICVSLESENAGLVIDPDHFSDNANKTSPDASSELHGLSDISRSQTLTYSDMEDALEHIVEDILYLCHSLFFVLEGKRLSSVSLVERQPSLLAAPFEKMNLLGLDLDAKSIKSQYSARQRKQIGDICLLVDMPTDAVLQYLTALEALKGHDDDLWIGAALEGLAVASYLVLQAQQSPSAAFTSQKRNWSFSSKQPKAMKSIDTPHSIHSGLDLASSRPKLVVSLEDVTTRYKEAISCYMKYPGAAVIEVEASLKATRILLQQGKRQLAAEFLHHVAYVDMENVAQSEKIARFDVMGNLYNDLKLYRKAAFFKRVAAMHSVNPSIVSPSWTDCYRMLVDAFPGFKMSFDPRDYEKEEMTGWPGIKIRVFHELIYAARQLGNSSVISRHISLALQTMFSRLSEKELADLSHLLQSYTTGTPDSGQPIVSERSVILPPVPFTHFPLLSKFEVIGLPPLLEPTRKLETKPSWNKIFIYSPLVPHKKMDRLQSTTQYEFCWVEGNPGAVDVSLHNPLPFELKITDFSLITDGVEFESYPSCHSLPADPGTHIINIVGTPRGHGTLRIVGYVVKLFGVTSRCLFSDLKHLKQKVFLVDVAPNMPRLQVSSDLPKSPYIVTGGGNKMVTSAILQLYIGERRTCYIKLKNVGSVPVERINISVRSDKYSGLISQLMECDGVHLQAQLPLAPGKEAELLVHASGKLHLSDLPSTACLSPGGSDASLSSRTLSNALIEAFVKIAYTGGLALLEDYHRQCLLALDTVVVPSLEVTSQEIQSVDSSKCLIVYEVLNQSNVVFIVSDCALGVKAADRKACEVSLKPMESKRITCVVPSVGCNSSLDDCRAHIQRLVTLTWRVSDTDRFGIISTTNLTWTEEQLRRLRQRPLTVEVNVVKNSCSTYALGTAVEVTVFIRNTSDCEFQNVVLKPLVFQETHTEIQEALCGSDYIVIGPSQHLVTRCGVGFEYQDVQTFVFLYPGQYTVRVQCLHAGQDVAMGTGYTLHLL